MSSLLDYGEEHDLLRTEVRRVLSERVSIAEVRRLQGDARGDDPTFWGALAELGWLGLVVPEAYGGAGLGFLHLAIVLEESGRALLPSPLLPATLAAIAIAHGASEAQRKRWLSRIAAGEQLDTLAFVEPDGSWSFGETSACRRDGKLSGSKQHVWAGATADGLLIPFLEAGDASRCRVARVDAAAPGVSISAEVGLDPSRRSARIELRDVAVPDDDVFPMPAEAIFAHLLPRACAALAAEQAGGADALLSMTSAYAAERKQFGKPIGAFQAVKHPLVNVLIEVEQGRSLVYAAAVALDSLDEAGSSAADREASVDAEELARMAKAQLSDAYGFAASRAIQLHGGFGFTFDCDAHLYFKRAQVSRAAWGDAAHHRRWIGDRLVVPKAGA